MSQSELQPEAEAPVEGSESSVHDKALALNLDAKIYGTFAEIGAGQEVSRWFFSVGGAAGSVAKTMSAYDMQMSDAIYGPCDRYVSRRRLVDMLTGEYDVLERTLRKARGAMTRFFVFADTVAARNYKGTNECHGWIGLRFQAQPGAQPSDILLHVNLRDPTNLLQQEAIGILGVNLIHGAFHRRGSMDELLQALFESLSLARIEIDNGELLGPAFDDWDQRDPSLPMLARGLCRLIAADARSRSVPPTELLYKQPIVVVRDRADVRDRPRTQAMLRRAADLLGAELGSGRTPLCLLEVEATGASDAGLREMLEHLDAYALPMLFSTYPDGYLLTEHVRRYTREPLRFVGEMSGLVQLFWMAAKDGEGGMLERLGRFLAQGVTAYVFPSAAEGFDRQLDRFGIGTQFCARAEGRVVTADSVGLQGPAQHLFRFLVASGGLVPVEAPPTT